MVRVLFIHSNWLWGFPFSRGGCDGHDGKKGSWPDRALETNAKSKLLQSRAAKGHEKLEAWLGSWGSVTGQEIWLCRLTPIILFMKGISFLPLLFTGVWTQNAIAEGKYGTDVRPQETPSRSLLSPQDLLAGPREACREPSRGLPGPWGGRWSTSRRARALPD